MGRTNVEEYYYVSKLHSKMGFQHHEKFLIKVCFVGFIVVMNIVKTKKNIRKQ